MIRSLLEYAQTVWSPFRAKMVEEVEKVQKLLLKIFSWTQTIVIHSASTKVTAAYIGVQKSQR